MLYPEHDPVEAVEVTGADLARLDPEEFLNDTVIDFYIKGAARQTLAPWGHEPWNHLSHQRLGGGGYRAGLLAAKKRVSPKSYKPQNPAQTGAV